MTGPLALILLPLAAGAATAVWARRNLLVADILGTSMHPTYQPGDKVLVRRLPAGRIRPGDVVVADVVVTREHLAAFATGEAAPQERPGSRPRSARSGRRHRADLRIRARGPAPSRVIKRVAAVPGDSVPASMPRRAGEASVPEGCFILLGDNPAHSLDSRHFGYIPAASVIGRVVTPLTPAGNRPDH
jgi:signal peptidase I